MAIFKSTLLSDIRGSLNGATFSRTRAGNIIRNRTQPVNPNTPAQADQRQLMSTAIDTFKGLSQAEVDEWADAIQTSGFTSQNALGDSYVPSAKQLVTSNSLNLLALGESVPPDVSKFLANPNLPDVIAGTPLITIAADVLTVMSVGVTSGGPETTAEVATTGIMLPTIRNYKKYLRKMGSGDADGIAINVATAWNAKFPSIVWADHVGNVIGFAVRVVDRPTGLASSWFYLGTVVIPASVP